MCGILCEVCFTTCSSSSSKDDKVLQRIQNRGPNHMQTVTVQQCDDTRITFCGAVLWMQGSELTRQPLENNNGILLYNGDIFDYTWQSDVSDTQVLMDKLSRQNVDSIEKHIIDILKQLKGPYCLIYYSKSTQDLYFSRDLIGRSTLLFHKNDNYVVISSVLGRDYDSAEIPATSIYCLNINNQTIKILPRGATSKCDVQTLDTWSNSLKLQQSIPDNEFAFDFDENVDLCDHDNILNYAENVAKRMKCKTEVMKKLISHNKINEVVLKLTKLLEKSVKIRLKRQPNKCKDCLQSKTSHCDHSAVGVLFSGGLDCTILALLADKYVPKEQSIDLVNVSFKKNDNASYDVPDRLTGRQSYEELRNLCPLRKWIWREVNVKNEELKHLQATRIADLVYPRQTILDESLGSALWFAARGKSKDTTSPCRVLLVGSGADELFGGYTRHRNAYKRGGWTGLERELHLDWNRISFRNLSRDNRVICDHGRQPRMPYLDEEFTEYVLQLKPWFKCIPSELLGPGLGDKLILRLVAYNLGLSKAATLPKRALQFGSRIANNKEKGSDISKTFSKLNQ